MVSYHHLLCLCNILMHLFAMPIFSLRIIFYFTNMLQGQSLKYKEKGREKQQTAALCPFIEHAPSGEVLLCLGTPRLFSTCPNQTVKY